MPPDSLPRASPRAALLALGVLAGAGGHQAPVPSAHGDSSGAGVLSGPAAARDFSPQSMKTQVLSSCR